MNHLGAYASKFSVSDTASDTCIFLHILQTGARFRETGARLRILCVARGVLHNISKRYRAESKRYRLATFLENSLCSTQCRNSRNSGNCQVQISTPAPAYPHTHQNTPPQNYSNNGEAHDDECSCSPGSCSQIATLVSSVTGKPTEPYGLVISPAQGTRIPIS
jgi:hypothetical protein